MQAEYFPSLSRKIARQHWRRVQWHILECSGWGAVLGALAVAMLRLESSASLVAIGGAAAVGAIAAMLWRPSRFSTLVRLDEQLQTRQLLSSAMWAQSNGEPLQNTLWAQAADFAPRLAQARWRTMGWRAWSSAALLVLAVLWIAPSGPVDKALDSSEGAAREARLLSDQSVHRQERGEAWRRAPVDARAAAQSERAADAGVAVVQATPAGGDGASGQPKGNSASGGGRGAGQSQSDRAPELLLPGKAASAASSAAAGEGIRIGEGATGSANSAAAPSDIHAAAGGAVDASAAYSKQPWRDAQWTPSNSLDAGAAAGATGDEVRDLVAAYFQR